jgi:hypothetical protein
VPYRTYLREEEETHSMLHLDLEDIRAGMVIDQDVLGAKG